MSRITIDRQTWLQTPRLVAADPISEDGRVGPTARRRTAGRGAYRAEDRKWLGWGLGVFFEQIR